MQLPLPFKLTLWLLPALLLTGCSKYLAGYDFTPQPATAKVEAAQEGQAAPLTALATIVGVRRDDDSAGIPTSVEAKLRLENDSDEVVTFHPDSLELLTADLIPFQRPMTIPGSTFTVAPKQVRTIVAYFPFPQGQSVTDTDLEGLHLRWQVAVGERLVRQDVTFERRMPTFAGYPSNYYYGGFYDRWPSHAWYGPRSYGYYNPHSFWNYY